MRRTSSARVAKLVLLQLEKVLSASSSFASTSASLWSAKVLTVSPVAGLMVAIVTPPF